MKTKGILLVHVATVSTILMKGLRKGQTGNLPTILRDQPRASSPTNDNYCVDKLQEGLLAGSQISTQRQTMNTYVNSRFVKVANTATVSTTLMQGLRKGQTGNLPTILHDQPRASSPTNDNYCVDKLQEGLLAGSQISTQGQTMNTYVNSRIVKVANTAPGNSQRKEISPGSAGCYYQKEYKLIYVKGVSCVTQLSCKTLTNVTIAAQNLPVGARLQNFWQTWLDLGAGPKVVQILKEGYSLPFRIWPNLTKSTNIISCYVNPHRNLYLLEALHQVIDKNTVDLVNNQRSLGFSTAYF